MYIFCGVYLQVFQYLPGQQYPAIMYSILLRRTGVYYTNVLVGPAVLLALLTAVMFLVPPESGQRLHIGW